MRADYPLWEPYDKPRDGDSEEDEEPFEKVGGTYHFHWCSNKKPECMFYCGNSSIVADSLQDAKEKALNKMSKAHGLDIESLEIKRMYCEDN